MGAFLDALLEAVPDTAVILDADGVVLKINRVPPPNRTEDFIGARAPKFIPPEYLDAFQEAFRMALETGQPATVETVVNLRDGRHFYILSMNRIGTEDEDKNVLLVGTDMTERRAIEEALRENENKLSAIMGNTTAVVYLKDLEGRYRFINKRFKNLFHVTDEEFLGKTDFDVFPQEMAEAFRRNDLKVLEEDRTLELEEVAPHDDGPHIYHSIKFPLHDSTGRIYGVCGMSSDITERKRAEEQLCQSEQRYRALAETTIAGISIVDIDEKLVFVNDAFARMLGYETFELLGRSLLDVTEPGVFRRYKELTQGRLSGRRDSYETTLRRRNGEQIHVQVYASPLLDCAGEFLGTLAVVTDITEQKKAQQELQASYEHIQEMNRQLTEQRSQLVQSEKMASIGQLAAGVAHEINNPVGYIMSNLGTLRDYAATIRTLWESYRTFKDEVANGQVEPQQESIARIEAIEKEEDLDFVFEDLDQLIAESQAGAERVRDIVLNLKSFARVDDAKAKEADLNECLESTLKICWNELKYKCTVEKDLQPLPVIPCFPGQLNQVFMNLLVNAAQAIPEKGVIRIATGVEDEEIVVRISDTGVGIPPENVKKLFDPFFTTKEVGKGTGLGLSIVHGIVQKHGGRIEVESEVGQGTTFTVRLPLAGIPEVAAHE